MSDLILLVDYKGNFSSKNNADPYLSGMNKELLLEEFNALGINAQFLHFQDIDFRKDWKNKLVLYTSQEDIGGKYKDFIEDIIYGLDLAGAYVIPRYKYLRAHNNKVLMEILRDLSDLDSMKSISTKFYGTLEELRLKLSEVEFPAVIKRADGAMSSNVELAKNKSELISKVKSLSKTKSGLFGIKDFLRPFKHKGYVRDSRHRQKFILQNFIPNLENDWKVLVFGDKYYVFQRGTRKNDFRASGSGHSGYLYGSQANIPEGLLDYAHQVFDELDVPCASLDIAFHNDEFHLFEFQAIWFGTVGQWRSDGYYKFDGETLKFTFVDELLSLEKVYSQSIHDFLIEKK